jgi:hypothetical protein
MGIGSSKEGVSVYGLLQRCVTGMVRHLWHLWHADRSHHLVHAAAVLSQDLA